MISFGLILNPSLQEINAFTFSPLYSSGIPTTASKNDFFIYFYFIFIFYFFIFYFFI